MTRLRCIIAALLAVPWMAPLGAQQPTGTIRGRVSDAATQQPLSAVTVTVGSRAALTQADGRYVITPSNGGQIGPRRFDTGGTIRVFEVTLGRHHGAALGPMP